MSRGLAEALLWVLKAFGLALTVSKVLFNPEYIDCKLLGAGTSSRLCIETPKPLVFHNSYGSELSLLFYYRVSPGTLTPMSRVITD